MSYKAKAMDYQNTLRQTLLVFILVITCSHGVRSGLDGVASPRRSYACEGSTLTITCGPGQTITVLRANYGRFGVSICNDQGHSTEGWEDSCMSTRSLRIVHDMCNDKPVCHIAATNRLFGDPCSDTPKYLEVQYKCIEASANTRPPPTRKPPDTTPASTTTSTETSTTSTTESTTVSTTTTTTPEPTTTKQHVKPEKPSDKPGKPDDTQPTHCQPMEYRDIEWPMTAAGREAVRPCPNNQAKTATWSCVTIPNVHWKGNPDLSKCVSKQVGKLHQKVRKARNIAKELENALPPDNDMDRELQDAKKQVAIHLVEEVANDLIDVSDRAVYGGDLSGVTEVMNDLSKQIRVQTHNVSKPKADSFVNNVTQAVVKTGSNLLKDDHKPSWHDLPQKDQAKAATEIMSSIETSAFELAHTRSAPAVITNIEVNIEVQVNIININLPIVNDVTFHPQSNSYNQDADYDTYMSQSEGTPMRREYPPGYGTHGNSIKLSGDTIKKYGVDGLSKLIFAVYKNLEEYMQPQQDQRVDENSDKYNTLNRNSDDYYSNNNEYDKMREEEEEFTNEIDVDVGPSEPEERQIVNSQVISASIGGHEDPHKEELPDPVFYTLEHVSENNVYNPTCSYWEYTEKTMDGRWSEFGCKVFDTNTTHTTCACTHMTNFAVLMNVRGTEVSEAHSLALTLITYIGCAISIVCLFFAFVTFTFFKNLQCDRNTIHKNLCLCLLIAEVIFLCGIAQTDKVILCAIVAGFLHYFFLAAFAWMLLEGVQLYVMLIEVFEAEKSRVKYYYAAAYCVPAIVVGISAAVDSSGYGTDKYCWLNVETGFIWAFVGPALGIILVNMVMLSIAIYMMCKHAQNVAAWKKQEKSRLDHIRSWIKGASVLVVLLGLTWAFGILFVDTRSTFMAYIFTILNSLQGLFIFIFHCVMNEKVQKEYKRCARKNTWLPDCIRVKYGGAKSYTSSTPNNSTGSNAFQRFFSGRWKRKASSDTSYQKSTSTTPIKPWKTSVQSPQSSSGVFTEPSDQNNSDSGYLEPVKSPKHNYTKVDFDDIENTIGMSCMEGSVVDSDFMMDYPKPPPKPSTTVPVAPINVDKYKIRPIVEETPQQMAPLLSEKTYDNNAEPVYHLYETIPEAKAGAACLDDTDEIKLIDESDDDSVKKAPLLSDSELSADEGIDEIDAIKRKIRKQQLDQNDLNKSKSSYEDDENNLTLPNIYGGNLKKDNLGRIMLPDHKGEDSSSQNSQNSLPSTSGVSAPTPAPRHSEDIAVAKLKKALNDNNEGQIQLYHGKKPEQRLSRDTQEALQEHRMRLTSSDC